MSPSEITLAPRRSLYAMVRLDGGVVRVTVDERSRALSGVGALVWELSDGRRTIAQLAAEIAARYDVEVERVQDDVTAFVHELASERFMALEPA